MKQYTLDFCENVEEVRSKYGERPSDEDYAMCVDSLDDLAHKILSDNYEHQEVLQLMWVLMRMARTMDVPPIINAATHILSKTMKAVIKDPKARSNALARAINLSKNPKIHIQHIQVSVAFRSLQMYGRTWDQARAYVAEKTGMSEDNVDKILAKNLEKNMRCEEHHIDGWLKELSNGGD